MINFNPFWIFAPPNLFNTGRAPSGNNNQNPNQSRNQNISHFSHNFAVGTNTAVPEHADASRQNVPDSSGCPNVCEEPGLVKSAGGLWPSDLTCICGAGGLCLTCLASAKGQDLRAPEKSLVRPSWPTRCMRRDRADGAPGGSWPGRSSRLSAESDICHVFGPGTQPVDKCQASAGN